MTRDQWWWPWCNVCKRGVEAVVTEERPAGRTYVAHCHGFSKEIPAQAFVDAERQVVAFERDETSYWRT